MIFRKAKEKDIPAIVALLANDRLGKDREANVHPLPDSYLKAFYKIDADEHQELIVVENKNFEIIGTLQLSFIQYLTYKGGIRAQIEAVRVREDVRGLGIGQKIFEWAIQRAKDKNAHLLQLTVDRRRPEAITFYEKLGFTSSHEGMKIHFL